ncbi:MAG: serine/threonine-protein kinase [Candidatus Melainabacteria bacterium]|nr:serine/threonine-protein kinase [Candidatus Melainabacteria bacterium]
MTRESENEINRATPASQGIAPATPVALAPPPNPDENIQTLLLRRFEATVPGPTLQITGSWEGLIPKEMTNQSKYWTSNNIAAGAAGVTEKNDVAFEASQQQQQLEDPLIGATIEGTYEILSILGKGGMAVVYLAKHIPTDRLVAMKAMKVNSAEDIMRFGREIRSHSRLHHRNIVQYMEFIATSTGEFFLVMERIKGLNLLDIIRSIGRIDGTSNIATIMLQSCDALAYAHNNGVTHRDLKTSNVVLVKEDDRDEIIVKILDFGIAHVEGEERITFTGRAIGSPMYMSPEQCSAKALGPRSDLYSLGIVAYEMFTGKPPYHKGSVRDIMYSHCTPDIEPPPMSDLVPHIPGIKMLDQIVLKALQTDPARRWDSAAQMKDAIEFWYEAVTNGDNLDSLPTHMIEERVIAKAASIEDFEITIKERDQIRHIKRTSSMQSSFGPGKPTSVDQERLQKNEEESSLRMHQANLEREKVVLIRLAVLSALLAISLITYFAMNFQRLASMLAPPAKPPIAAPAVLNPGVEKTIANPTKDSAKKSPRKKRRLRAPNK